MTIQYVNRKGKTYYLHQGTTKKGNPKYYFSMKSEGNLVDEIPEGYEIYENPNAQVFLRRVRPKIITDEEVAIVEEGMRQFSSVKYFQVDVKKNVIIIYTASQNVEGLTEVFGGFFAGASSKIKDALTQSITYSPMLQFELVDQEKRHFITQRYCFLGSIDDWIQIGGVDSLPNLVKQFVKHLGEDSYYELH